MTNYVLRSHARWILAAFAALLCGLVLIAWLLSLAVRPPVRYDYLTALQTVPAAADYDLVWTSGAAPIGRQPAPADLDGLATLLREALSGHVLSSPLPAASDQAYRRLSAERESADGMTIRLASQAHVDLAHVDGSLYALSLTSDVARLSADADGRLALEMERLTEIARIRTAPRGLRLHQLEATGARSFDGPREKAGPVPDSPLVGFNYYPASAPWTDFLAVFPVEEIERDFAEMAGLGANAVRVFLPQSAFAKASARETSLDQLEALMDLAASHGLRVIATPFDMGLDYAPAAWPAAWSQLDAILNRIGDHPALYCIDLKNEPDLDDSAFGSELVDHFLTAMAVMTRQHHPDMRLTIGWSSAEHASRLVAHLDIVSFHDFEAPETLPERLAAVRDQAGTRPVMVTEIGHTRQFPFGSAAAQARALTRQFEALGAVEGAFVWTLRDFDTVPSTVAGWQPWRRAMQAQYGLAPPAREAFSSFAASRLNQFQHPQNGENP